jgi:hypothetical protein
MNRNHDCFVVRHRREFALPCKPFLRGAASRQTCARPCEASQRPSGDANDRAARCTATLPADPVMHRAPHPDNRDPHTPSQVRCARQTARNTARTARPASTMRPIHSDLPANVSEPCTTSVPRHSQKARTAAAARCSGVFSQRPAAMCPACFSGFFGQFPQPRACSRTPPH